MIIKHEDYQSKRYKVIFRLMFNRFQQFLRQLRCNCDPESIIGVPGTIYPYISLAYVHGHPWVRVGVLSKTQMTRETRMTRETQILLCNMSILLHNMPIVLYNMTILLYNMSILLYIMSILLYNMSILLYHVPILRCNM